MNKHVDPNNLDPVTKKPLPKCPEPGCGLSMEPVLNGVHYYCAHKKKDGSSTVEKLSAWQSRVPALESCIAEQAAEIERLRGKNATLIIACEAMQASRDAALAKVDELQQRLLTAAGDDLCRLTQDEIKAMTSGAVPIPPKPEFLASCERFHDQIASESGVNQNCLTLAQLIAENEQLRASQRR